MQDYLLTDYWSTGENAGIHSYITSTLLTYLCLDRDIEDEGAVNPNLQNRNTPRPFLAYACLTWGFHARSASPLTINVLALEYLKSNHTAENDLISNSAHAAGKIPPSHNHYISALHRFSLHGTGLHIVAAFGLPDLVGLLLDQGADIEAVDLDRNTALHFAVSNGQYDAALVLMKRNANTNVANCQRRTPLYDAVANADHQLVLELVKWGAEVEVECEDRWTPLHKATDNGDLVIARTLMKHGARIETLSLMSLMPLHRAAGNEHVDVMKELLDAGSLVDWETYDGWSPLHGACSRGQHAAVRMLVAYHANIDLQSLNGRSPLHRACKMGDPYTVSILLENGADIMCKDNCGNLPLHRAAKGGSEAVANLLLIQPQVQPEMLLGTRNCEDQTPREYAAHQGDWRMAEWLQIKEQNCVMVEAKEVTGIEKAVREGDLPRLKSLLDDGADISQKTSAGLNIFDLLLILHREEIAETLVESPELDLEASTAHGWRALHHAANSGNSNLVRLCLSHGAMVVSETCGGQTPLHKACKSGNLECVKLLLEAGAPVETTSYGIFSGLPANC